jgi:hypothetical protein
MPKDCQLLSYSSVEERRGMRTKEILSVLLRSCMLLSNIFVQDRCRLVRLMSRLAKEEARRTARPGSRDLASLFLSGITAYVFVRH